MPDALHEGFGWVVLKELMEPPYGAESLSTMTLLEAFDEAAQDFVLSPKIQFLRAWLAAFRSLAPRAVLRLGNALTSP